MSAPHTRSETTGRSRPACEPRAAGEGSQARSDAPSILACAAAGAVAGAAAGLVDGALTLARGPVLARFLLVAIGVMALAGGLLAPALLRPLAALRRAWAGLGVARPSPATVVALAWASLVLAVLLHIAGAGLLTRQTPPARLHRYAWEAAAIAVLVVALARVLTACLRRRPRLVAPATLGLVVACLLALREAGALAVDVDVRFVWVAAVYGLALFAAARRPWTRPAWSRRIVVAAAAAGVAATVTIARAPAVRLVAARYSPATGSLARLLGRLADLDGDGFSPLGGEGDCAALDASVHPFAADRPGDGVDQDCHGGDLDPSTLPPAEFAAPGAPAPGPRPNLVWISVETLRADHLGLYGYGRDTSPNLDRWFGGAAVFERAYTVSPVTDRTLPSWLGGMMPSMYTEALDYKTHVLSPARVLLPERLRDAGYHTIVVNSFHLFDDHGLVQGIDDLTILDNARLQDAARTTSLTLTRVAEALRRRPGRPLFVWVHYYEPHARYTPPPQHRLWGEAPIDLYDGEIHYVDAQIGALLTRLREIGVLEGALVVLAADHGEEFLEHGRTQHAYAVYEETVRVPFAVVGPGVVPRRIAAPVSLLDLAPTLLDVLQIPVMPGIDGRSQAAALRGGAPDRPLLLIEQFRHGSDHIEKIAAIEGSFKLILDLDNQLWELYDLEADPGERDNLYGRDLERSLALREAILDHHARAQAVRLLASER